VTDDDPCKPFLLFVRRSVVPMSDRYVLYPTQERNIIHVSLLVDIRRLNSKRM